MTSWVPLSSPCFIPAGPSLRQRAGFWYKFSCLLLSSNCCPNSFDEILSLWNKAIFFDEVGNIAYFCFLLSIGTPSVSTHAAKSEMKEAVTWKCDMCYKLVIEFPPVWIRIENSLGGLNNFLIESHDFFFTPFSFNIIVINSILTNSFISKIFYFLG